MRLWDWMRRLLQKRWVAATVCVVLAAAYVWPLWRTLDHWGGTFDWGYFFFLAEVDRKTVVEFGQFPLWNPYYCGGAVHLANPQTYFLSPTFLFILLFGTPIGIRLTLTFAIVLAFDGMRRFLATLGIGTPGRWVGAAGYAICGTMAQHLGGGHVGWVGFCVLPYVLHSFNRALAGEKRHIVYGGLLLAWIFGHFGGYTFPYSALTVSIYGLLWAVHKRNARWGVIVLTGMLLLSLALAAVRVIPILEFMQGHPRLRPDFDIVKPTEMFEIYVVRHRQRGVPGHPYVWPEYGNYFGLAGSILALLGGFFLVRRRRDLWPLLVCLVVFLVFQVGNVPGFPWWLLKHLPVFRYMRAPSRFTIVVGIFIAALIAVAVDEMLRARPSSPASPASRADEPPRARRWLFSRLLPISAVVLSVVFLIDAATFNCEQWFQTVTTPPPNDPVAPSFQQTHGDRRRMYAYPRTNRGTLDCFEEAPLDISPRLRSQPPAEEYPLDPASGTVRRVTWTPNRIVVDVAFSRPGVVVINQNFHPGWRVDGGSPVNEGGLLAARVEPGQRLVSFRFMPTSFLIGLAISITSFLAALALWIRWRPRSTASEASR